MTGTVTFNRAGEERSIPLAALDLPENFSDGQLKSAVAAEIDAPPEEISGHMVKRDGDRIVLHGHTEASD